MHIFSEIVRKSATAFIQLSTDFRQTIDFTFDFIKNSKNSTPSSMKTSFKFGFKRYNNLMKKNNKNNILWSSSTNVFAKSGLLPEDD